MRAAACPRGRGGKMKMMRKGRRKTAGENKKQGEKRSRIRFSEIKKPE